MNCDYIRNQITNVIINCNVKSFPIDCFKILKHYGFKIYTYSELKIKNQDLYEMCIAYSDDSFRMGSMQLIAYDEARPQTRIRFSLMHELGHYILGHKNDTKENEEEANYFASNLLAPRIAMYYTRLQKVREIAELFKISYSAACYAAQDFSEWCNSVRLGGMHDYDKKLYSQFYNDDYGGFVYSIQKCEFCGAPIYNEKLPLCRTTCDLPPEPRPRMTWDRDYDMERALSRLHEHWLYNF